LNKKFPQVPNQERTARKEYKIFGSCGVMIKAEGRNCGETDSENNSVEQDTSKFEQLVHFVSGEVNLLFCKRGGNC
jgi:hypothetical protein